jgi:hypothetical protein
MSGAPIILSAVGSSNAITYSWTYFGISAENISGLKLIITDQSQDTSSTKSGIYSYVIDASAIVSKTFTVNGLKNGDKYNAILVGNGVKSKSITSMPITTPSAPIFIAHALDGGVNIQINNMSGVKNVVNTGYSPITNVDIAISCDDNINTYSFNPSLYDLSNNVSLDPSNNMSFNIEDLSNGTPYEVSVSVDNTIGSSGYTKPQQTFTPLDTPSPVKDLAVYPNIYLYAKGIDASSNINSSSNSIFWNSPEDMVSLINNKTPIQSYTIVRDMYDASNAIIPDSMLTTKILVDVSGNPLLIKDASGNPVGKTIDNMNYKYKHEDTTCIVGKKYRYTVYATNSNGAGPIAFVSGVAATKPLPPSIVVDPSYASLFLILKDSGVLNGLDVSGNAKYVLDISGNTEKGYGYFYFSTNTFGYDASKNSIKLQKIPQGSTLATAIPLSNIGNNLINGTLYTLNIQTVGYVNGTAIYSDKLQLTSTPYTNPLDVSGNTIRLDSFDAMGVPLDKKFQIFWNKVTDLGGNKGTVTYDVYDASDNKTNLTNIPQDLSNNELKGTINSIDSKPLVNGNLYGFYIRTSVFNTETKQTITSKSPVKEGRPYAYPLSVENLQLLPDPFKKDVLQASWDHLENATTGGFKDIKYKLVLTDLSANTHVDLSGNGVDLSGNGVDLSGNLFTTLKSASIIGKNPKLIPGNPYKLTVWSEGILPGKVISNNSSKIAAIPFLPPSAPKIVAVSPMDGKIRITYDKPDQTNGIALTKYEIFNKIYNQNYTDFENKAQYVYSTGISDASLSEIAIISKYNEMFDGSSIAAITNGTSYVPCVRAVGIVGGYTINGETLPQITVNGELSNVLKSELTNSDASINFVIPNTAPSAPEGLTATAGNGTVTLSWTIDTENKEYILFQDNEVTNRFLSNDSQSTPFTDLSYNSNSQTLSKEIRNLVNGKMYSFGLVAVNKTDITSIQSSISTAPYTTPDKVENVNFTINDKSLSLTWDAPKNNGGADVNGNSSLFYKVNIKTDLSGNDASIFNNYMTVSSTTTGLTTKAFTADKLVNGKPYAAEIIAYFNIDSNSSKPSSGESKQITNIIPNIPPQDVSGITAVASDRTVKLTWKNPTDTLLYPRQKITIERTGKDANGVSLLTYSEDLSANVVSYTDVSSNNLFNGNTYTYKITSVTDKLVGQPSGVTSSSVTPFGIPIFIGLKTISEGNMYELTLSKNGSNLTNEVVIGIPKPESNNQIQVITSELNNITYNNVKSNIHAANQITTLPISFPSGVVVDALFIAINNGAGAKTAVFPSGTKAFDVIPN